MILRRIDLLEDFIESRKDGDTVFSQDLVDYFVEMQERDPVRVKKILGISHRMATRMLRNSERVVSRMLTRQERRTFKTGTTYIFTITKG